MSVNFSFLIILFLAASGLFLRFAFRAYNYLGYMLIYASLLCCVFRYSPSYIAYTAFILTVFAAMVIILIELCIVKSSFPEGLYSARYAVVLGAAVLGTRPSKALIHRCDAAVEYLTSHKDAVAVLSGGRGRGENISEAEAMREYLVSSGISPQRLFIEDLSDSTYSNLRNSFQVLSGIDKDYAKSTVIISSNYHLYRAKKIALSMNVNASGYPAKPGQPLAALNLFIREAIGIIYIFLTFRKNTGDR